ncbi:membrane protein [Rhodococcus rhodochrous]|nr:membrane protein [Rhodococcus rhodochrous]
MSEDVRHDQGSISVKQGIAAGTSVGAAVILATVGVVQFFQGIAAVAEDELFVQGQEYTFKFDFTAWGWIHILLGVAMVVVGIALITGATWARVAAIVIAAVSILANFLWLPYYPWWSILIIALDVVVIWAVSTWNPRADYY